MENSVELKESDIFFFSKGIFYKVLGDNTLVISPNTANWIVINSEKEKSILKLLIDGNSIGNIGCMDVHLQLRDWLIELKNYKNSK